MYKIVIVDDDPMVAKINKIYANSVNQVIVDQVFHDGISALNYLKNNSVDLVILDVFMPKLNGIDLLNKNIIKNINFLMRKQKV